MSANSLKHTLPAFIHFPTSVFDFAYIYTLRARGLLCAWVYLVRKLNTGGPFNPRWVPAVAASKAVAGTQPTQHLTFGHYLWSRELIV